jgi:NADPH:quinone reductase-like Zn-dependent oxidoreductase
VILDSVGGQNLVDSISALAHHATLVSVGVVARAGLNIEARDLWAKTNALREVFLGVLGFATSRFRRYCGPGPLLAESRADGIR